MQSTFFQQHLEHLARTASTVDPDVDTANNFRFHHLLDTAQNNDDITITIGSPSSETSHVVPATSSSSTNPQTKNKWSSRPFLSNRPKLIEDTSDHGYDTL
jgi:vancomycin resistance protein YoaR